MFAFLGMLLGVGVVILANFREGDPLSSLLQADAALIVFGGTISALLVHAEPQNLICAVKHISWLTKPPNTDSVKFINEISEWSQTARKNVLALEPVAAEVKDNFTKLGLEMIIGNKSYEEVRDMLYLVGDVEDRDYGVGGEIWEAAGGYAPTIGVLGAVLGLIHVMLNLNHPSTLGTGIATAFVATVYGVGTANLIFFPLGNRLKAIAGSRSVYREIVAEGLLLLKRGVPPLEIRERLESLLESRRRAQKGNDQDEVPVRGEPLAAESGG